MVGWVEGAGYTHILDSLDGGNSCGTSKIIFSFLLHGPSSQRWTCTSGCCQTSLQVFLLLEVSAVDWADLTSDFSSGWSPLRAAALGDVVLK